MINAGMCGRCYQEEVLLVKPLCNEKPELVNYGGMYHCPDCGAMILAGVMHPLVCLDCRDLKKEGFDGCK